MFSNGRLAMPNLRRGCLETRHSSFARRVELDTDKREGEDEMSSKTVAISLVPYFQQNGFSDCDIVADDLPTLCLKEIDDARIQVKLLTRGSAVVVEVYAHENWESCWNRFGSTLKRHVPTGCTFREFGRKIRNPKDATGGALLIRYNTGLTWQPNALTTVAKTRIVDAVKDLVSIMCR